MKRIAVVGSSINTCRTFSTSRIGSSSGYPVRGTWHRPDMKVVSLYIDQKPAGDLSGERAKEFGFTVYPTIAEALRCGGDKLAVDAVLIVCEHGDYPRNEKGQILYPRYEFFKQCTDVFEKDGRAVPVYNDKHLSWSFEKAKCDGGRVEAPEIPHARRLIPSCDMAPARPGTTSRMPDRRRVNGR